MNLFLENKRIKITFNRENGAIIGLLNKETGWQVIRQPGLAMGIQLLVPIKDHRNNRASSKIQKLSAFDKKTETMAGLYWDKITANHSGDLDISVFLLVELDGISISFIMTIDNRSPYIIEEVWNPCLGGIREPAEEKCLESLSVNMCGGLSKEILGDGFPQKSGYYGTIHPTFIKTFPDVEAQTSFILLANNTQGLYLGMHDKELNIVNFVHELKPGYLDSKNKRVPSADTIGGKPIGYVVSAVRLPFIEPGKTIKLAPIVINLFKGTWHNGVEQYKKWRKTWFFSKPEPEWLKEIDCWFTLQMNTPEGDCRYRYTDLVEIAGEARDKGVGAIQLIGWARDGQDGAEPYQDIDPRLGTREELKEAIRKAESMGVRILLMCKFKWADISIPEFKEELLSCTLRDMYGNYVQFEGYAYETMTQQLTGGSRRTGAGLCHLSEEYRKIALREFKKILELGSSGILYDELASNMLLCFDTSHDHKWGESNFKGSLMLAKEFYETALDTRKDFLLAGEGPNDHLSQYYLVSYVRTWNGEWGGLNEENYIAAWKYLNPQMRFATCITGWDDREMINQCLVNGYIINYEPYNFKGKLSDFPDTVAYGMKAQRLRRRLWDYIWDGIFKDTIGVELSYDGKNSACLYSVFENRKNNKRAVVIANQDHENDLDVRLLLDNGIHNFDMYDIENDSVKICSGSLTVKRRSLKVLVER